MKDEDKKQLSKLLQSIDEGFLVALSNKGLVRRAQKDLEGVSLQIEESEDCLVVHGSDWTVWMPGAGPTKARDDTKATGITRQILSATIYLRDNWAPTSELSPPSTSGGTNFPQPVVRDAGNGTPSVLTGCQPASADPQVNDEPQSLQSRLLDLSIEDLTKWSGKKLVTEVLMLFKQPAEIDIDHPLGLTIKLPQHDIELRLLPSKEKGTKLLDQILSTAPKALHKHWVLVGILSLHRKFNKQINLPIQTIAEESESPRSRGDVIKEAMILLENMLTTGVAHASTRMVERLYTLSMSASAVHLPRVSHLMRSLAEDVTLLLDRHAAADTERLFSSMSRAHSLLKAIALAGSAIPLDLAGIARTQYDPAGDIDLAAVAAYPWQTSSGYEGLSVLFWDSDKKRFLSWSASRPTATSGQFDFNQIYNTDSIWSGGGGPRGLCGMRFTLSSASTNSEGRLSGTKQSSVKHAIKATPADMDFEGRLFRSWAELRHYAAEQFPLGLRLKNPLDRIVVVEPKTWHERYFDEMQQALCWQVRDDGNEAITMILPWSRTNERAIEFMESLKPDRDGVTRVVARMVYDSGGCHIEPIAFISKGTPRGDVVLNPAFDLKLIEYRQSELLSRLRKKFGLERISTTMTADDDWEETMQIHNVDAVPPQIRNLLSETESLLLKVAESGAHRLQEVTRSRFTNLSDTLNRCGLTELSQKLRTIAEEQSIADQILSADYLCQLHWQVLTQSLSERL